METEMLVSGDSNRQSHIGNGSSFDGKIEFHMARKPFLGVVNFDNKFQLETLNPTVLSGNIGQETKSATLFTANKAEGVSFGRNGFDPELSFGNTFRRIGAGLENLGNTCFLNSVLQCLTYTEPLVAYFQSGMHQSSCQTAGFCSVCAIQKHVSRALHATGRSLAPKDLVSNLRCISRTFRTARQEDAHEYMVHLLESMHRCCLPKGVPSESPSAYEKSLVHRIFGGRLQSQVRCMQCTYGSNKYDPFLDLSLEIAKADTLQKALGHFTAIEELDGGAKQYQCQQCKQKVRAVKQLTIHDAPYVLTIHLKRFCAYDPRQKNDKKVVFSPTLDLKPFVSGSHEGSLMYTLYGVLVHAGWSTHSGHYYCFVRTSTGMWYNLDDNRVVQVNERTVMEQKAYMLFYVRDKKKSPPKKPCNVLNERMGSHANGNNIILSSTKDLKDVGRNGSLENHVDNGKSVTAAKEATDVKEIEGVSPIDSTTATSSATSKITLPDLAVSPLPKDTIVESRSEVVESQPPTGSCNNIEGSLGIGTVASNKENVPKEDVSISANILPDCSIVQHPENIKPVIDDKSQPPTGSCNNIEGSRGIGTVASNKGNVPKEDVSISANILPDCSMVQHPENIKPVIDDKSQLMVGEGCPLGVSVSSGSSKEEPESKIGSTVSAEQSVTLPVSSKTNGQVEILECSTTIKSKRRLVKPLIITMRLSTNFMCGSSARLCKKKFKQSRQTIFKNKSCAQENLETVASTSETVSKSPPSRQKKRKSPSKEKLLGTTASTSETVSKSPHSRLKKRKSPSKEKLLDPVKAELLSKNTPSKKTVGECGTRTDSGDVVLVANKPVKSMLSNEFKGGVDAKHCLHSGAEKISSLQTGLKRGLAEPIVARWDGTLSSNEHLISMTCESTRIGYVPDEWDEEYDHGKRKKVKLPKDSFDGRNPFQDLAAIKASFEKLRKDRSSSRNRPYRIARV